MASKGKATKKKAGAKQTGFQVNQCSVCDQMLLTFGQQKIGGIRFCKECYQSTLAWVQTPSEMKVAMMANFATLEETPEVQALLAQAKQVTPDLLKANAIGESARRLYDSLREEARYE